MADGGEVGHFCSTDRSHNPECEYYVDGGVVPESDLPIAQSQPEEVPEHDLPGQDEEVPQSDLPTNGKYETAGQHALGDIEAAGSGALGFLPTLFETKALGMNPEDIKGRAEAYPTEHAAIKTGAFVGSMLAGPAKMIATAAGSKALGLLLQGVAFQGSDEVEKALLNHPGSNPSDAVAPALLHMGLNGLLTMGLGGLGRTASTGLEALQNPKIIEAAQTFAREIAEKGKPLNKLVSNAVGFAGSALSSHLGGGPVADMLAYQATKKLIRPYLEKIAARPNAYVTAAILHAIETENFLSIPTAIKFGQSIAKGIQKAVPAVEALFKSASRSVVPPVTDEMKNEVKDWVDEGGVNKEIQDAGQPQTFADGGMVGASPEAFGSLYPAQNALVSEARGRISNYLSTLKPQPHQQKLAFDDELSTKEQERQYDMAVGLAAHPMSILNHVQSGTITPDLMKHFTTMYPEVHNYLSKKITEQVTKAQLAGEKPSYQKRQALSMFLGANLDSSLTPQAIMTAQATFAKAMPQQQSPMPKKKNKGAALKLADGARTDDQARETRLQKV